MKRRLTAVDIETIFINGSHFPSVIALCRKNVVVHKTNQYTNEGRDKIVKKALKSLMSKVRNNYVYTHNFSNFDSYFLLQGMKKMGFQILDVYTKGFSVIFVRAKYKSRMFYFKDSYLLLPSSLSSLGKLTGYDKDQFTLSLVNQNSEFSKKYLYYLIYDVLVLYFILRKSCNLVYYIYKLHFSKFISIAHMSYNIFRKRFLKCFLLIKSIKKNTFIKRSYFGAMVEVKRYYGKHLKYYDINSMYPYVMLGNLP